MRFPEHPARWNVEQLRGELARGDAFLWSLERFRERATERLGVPSVAGLSEVPASARRLVVLGGGAMIDEAKVWRRETRPDLWLAALPSLFGSGAEASPVAVLNRDGVKKIEVDERLLPDVRVVWPELLEDLPPARLRAAAGDALSHALEGFLSPLADEELRGSLAEILAGLLALPLAPDPDWFEASAAACAAQSRAGVGLVHGIAHQLEGRLAGERDGAGFAFGHAKLCSLFLAPVLAFDRAHSPKLAELAVLHGIDLAVLETRAWQLFDGEDYSRCLPALEANWRAVLLDPCTRTNSVLVRPQHLAFFTEERFR
ncbi:MAG TPA: iron-containing alcohol dehydrogenase [Planctomycetes bacterium]|nr:iron-containing alcohol dehydrogenase [Planctomycetota bacterium]